MVKKRQNRVQFLWAKFTKGPSNLNYRYFPFGWRSVNLGMSLHCKYLNAWSECNDIVISVYSHYPLDLNAKSSDTKGTTFSIRWFCIRIERVMSVYGNYDVIAFRSCIQIFTVYIFAENMMNRKNIKKYIHFYNQGNDSNTKTINFQMIISDAGNYLLRISSKIHNSLLWR